MLKIGDEVTIKKLEVHEIVHALKYFSTDFNWTEQHTKALGSQGVVIATISSGRDTAFEDKNYYEYQLVLVKINGSKDDDEELLFPASMLDRKILVAPSFMDDLGKAIRLLSPALKKTYSKTNLSLALLSSALKWYAVALVHQEHPELATNQEYPNSKYCMEDIVRCSLCIYYIDSPCAACPLHDEDYDCCKEYDAYLDNPGYLEAKALAMRLVRLFIKHLEKK